MQDCFLICSESICTFRNVTKTSAAATAATAALMITVNCKPCIKEPRAMSRSIEPKLPGSCPTSLTAPPRLSSAASSASGGMPAGIFLANSVRYIVVPMLPKTAMPRAPQVLRSFPKLPMPLQHALVVERILQQGRLSV